MCCRVSRSRGTADFTQLANWLGERAAHRSMDPRSDRLRLPCCADVSCTPDGRNAASAGPCSSYDRGGYAWRGSLGPTGCATVRSSSARRAFRPRWASTACESRRDPAIAIEFASSARRRVLSPQGHGAHVFPSLCRVRAQGRGLEPRAFGQIETRPPGRWGNAGRSTAPAPQSKPVTHASRLVAQVASLMALGLRAENPGRRASSITTLLLLRAVT